MTDVKSGTKKILCFLEEFTLFKSLIEMLFNTGLNEPVNQMNPRIFLVQDSIGSEFMEFFTQEIREIYPVKEFRILKISAEQQLTEIAEIFNSFANSNENKEKDSQKTESDVPKESNLGEKKILFWNNPIITLPEDREQINKIIKYISLKLEEFSQYVLVLRLVSDTFPMELIEKVDFQFTIPFPSKIQRIAILEGLLNDLNIHTVDITHVSELTEECWNVLDLERLVKQAFLQWKLVNYAEYKSRLDNQQKEEDQKDGESFPNKRKLLFDNNLQIPLTAEIFTEIINTRKVLPLGMYKSYNNLESSNKISPSVSNSDPSSRNFQKKNVYMLNPMEGLGMTEIDSFTSSQLYQYAAANNFEELTVVLEKLDQAKKLDDLDRKILSNYAFILKDPPNRALLKLTNARKTMDRIQKISER